MNKGLQNLPDFVLHDIGQMQDAKNPQQESQQEHKGE